MTGPSVVLDPLTHAVRGDLADVRLAEYVFAPHYAAPLTCRLIRDETMHSDRAGVHEVAGLASGEPFEVLELAGARAWGVAPQRGLVGYVDRSALDQSARTAA